MVSVRLEKVGLYKGDRRRRNEWREHKINKLRGIEITVFLFNIPYNFLK